MARRQLLKLSGVGLTLALGVATGAVTSTSAASASDTVALRLVDYWGDEPAGQVRLLLDKRVGDAVTFAFTTGAVRSAWARSSSSRIAVS